ncbi:phosphotransferase enzyme family protein [Candidatus Poribacteria bacterium]
MNNRLFPIQNSTLSADALAERVLKRYHLPGQAVCRFFRKGICDTYRIEAGGVEYYLKVYRFGRRTRRDVTEEVRLLNYLDGHGIFVARPVMRKDGLYVNRLAAPEGTRYAVLFEAAHGLEDDDTEDCHIKEFGAMVARMHQCADNMSEPYSREHLDMKHLLDDNLMAIAELMAHRGADFGLIKDIAEHCRKHISQLLPKSKPEYGVCHGDLHGGDVRYGENNIPVLFDFDSSGCGWRALDIGVFLASDEWMDITSEVENRRQSRLAAFLEGYSSIRRPSESELSVIQLGPPVRHIYLMGFVLRYTTVYDGEHWANDHFIDWHMLWFRHWAQNHLAKEI